MKYCSKHHKNPDDAVFCNECGERLTRVTNTSHICPKCGMRNPIEAIYCRECGTKLPDANGNVELTVYSSEICDRISAVGANSYETNTSKCVLKVPARKTVDILLQCGGKPFRITTDLTKSNTLNVNWGTIEIQCEDCCQVRMTGRNMDVPLIKQNASREVVKVPYGVYTIKFELDGETEEMTVDVQGKIKVESHLHRRQMDTSDIGHFSHEEKNQFQNDYDRMKSCFGTACMWFISAIFSGCVLSVVGCILYGSLMGDGCWMLVICDILCFLCSWGVMKLIESVWSIWKWAVPITIFLNAASSSNILLHDSYPPLYLVTLILLIVGYWGTFVITKKNSYFFH